METYLKKFSLTNSNRNKKRNIEVLLLLNYIEFKYNFYEFVLMYVPVIVYMCYSLFAMYVCVESSVVIKTDHLSACYRI